MYKINFILDPAVGACPGLDPGFRFAPRPGMTSYWTACEALRYSENLKTLTPNTCISGRLTIKWLLRKFVTEGEQLKKKEFWSGTGITLNRIRWSILSVL